MSRTLDTDVFEYVLCRNAMFNPAYTSSIMDYYKPEYFNNGEIRTVLNTTLDFFQKRSVLPNNTELSTLLPNPADKQAFINVVTKLKDFDKEYNIDELYANTEKFFREKAVYNALLSVTSKLNKEEMNTEQILEIFNQACTISLIDEMGLEFFEQINQLCNEFTRTDNVMSTGWKWLDERLGGGWQADGRALYVFTGFTNVGKSIFLGNITVNLLRQNKNVLLISLEMPELMYAKRICSNITQIPFNMIHQRTDELKHSILDFKSEYNCKLIIKEFATKTMTIHHMNSYIQKLLKSGFKPDAIVVDYLNLMKNVTKGAGTYEEVKQLSEQLRASTYLFKVPVITATQLNRKGAGVEEPGLETTSESIGVSFTCDGQFSIWASEEDRKNGLIHMGIQKNRYGPNFGRTTFKIDFNTLTLFEMEQIPTSMSNQELNKTTDTLDALNKKLST